MNRWNRTVAWVVAVLLTVGARGVAAQADPASPDQGGASAVGAETWYTQPWIWIVLGVVLLFAILVLTTKRGGRTRT